MSVFVFLRVDCDNTGEEWGRVSKCTRLPRPYRPKMTRNYLCVPRKELTRLYIVFESLFDPIHLVC